MGGSGSKEKRGSSDEYASGVVADFDTVSSGSSSLGSEAPDSGIGRRASSDSESRRSMDSGYSGYERDDSSMQQPKGPGHNWHIMGHRFWELVKLVQQGKVKESECFMYYNKINLVVVIQKALLPEDQRDPQVEAIDHSFEGVLLPDLIRQAAAWNPPNVNVRVSTSLHSWHMRDSVATLTSEDLKQLSKQEALAKARAEKKQHGSKPLPGTPTSQPVRRRRRTKNGRESSGDLNATKPRGTSAAAKEMVSNQAQQQQSKSGQEEAEERRSTSKGSRGAMISGNGKGSLPRPKSRKRRSTAKRRGEGIGDEIEAAERAAAAQTTPEL